MRPMVGYITDKLIRREGNYMILKESWYDHTVYGMWYVVCEGSGRNKNKRSE